MILSPLPGLLLIGTGCPGLAPGATRLPPSGGLQEATRSAGGVSVSRPSGTRGRGIRQTRH